MSRPDCWWRSTSPAWTGRSTPGAGSRGVACRRSRPNGAAIQDGPRSASVMSRPLKNPKWEGHEDVRGSVGQHASRCARTMSPTAPAPGRSAAPWPRSPRRVPPGATTRSRRSAGSCSSGSFPPGGQVKRFLVDEATEVAAPGPRPRGGRTRRPRTSGSRDWPAARRQEPARSSGRAGTGWRSETERPHEEAGALGGRQAAPGAIIDLGLAEPVSE